jgi:isopentenyl diphosphate isomerase/L-lactate dehydrogenase-like FMN-dependent dehydrogenase
MTDQFEIYFDSLEGRTPAWGSALRWEDLTWPRSLTTVLILLKRIRHFDDARSAKDYGVDGIYRPNHGGRPANGVLPALNRLPGVVEAADGIAVLFDSGVHSGSDVAKALTTQGYRRAEVRPLEPT